MVLTGSSCADGPPAALDARHCALTRLFRLSRFFSTEKRPALKALEDAKPEEERMKFGEYGKKLGGMWKEMDEEAKAPYQAKAVADKERYAKEMESYTPPSAEE